MMGPPRERPGRRPSHLRMTPMPMWSDLHVSVLKSKPFSLAVGDNTDSITGRNLRNYLDRSLIEGPEHPHLSELDDVDMATSESLFFQALSPKPNLPKVYRDLLKLQHRNGIWADLDAVLACLSMPAVYNVDGYAPWEVATALAMVFIRQSGPEMYEVLGTFHDKAYFSANIPEDLIFLTREAINDYRFKDLTKEELNFDATLDEYLDNFEKEMALKQATADHDKKEVDTAVSGGSSAGGEQSNPGETGDDTAGGDGVSRPHSAGRNSRGQSRVATPNVDLTVDGSDWKARYTEQYDVKAYGADFFDSADEERWNQTMTFCRTVINNERRSVFFRGEDEDSVFEEMSGVLEDSRADYGIGIGDDGEDSGEDEFDDEKTLKTMLTDLDQDADLRSIIAGNGVLKVEKVALQKEIEALKVKLALLLGRADQHIEDVKTCLKKCTATYRTVPLRAGRNIAFDELTVMLGDGHEAVMTSNTEWKRKSIPGYRTICVDILNAMRDLSRFITRVEEIRMMLKDTETRYETLKKVKSYKISQRFMSMKSMRDMRSMRSMRNMRGSKGSKSSRRLGNVSESTGGNSGDNSANNSGKSENIQGWPPGMASGRRAISPLRRTGNMSDDNSPSGSSKKRNKDTETGFLRSPNRSTKSPFPRSGLSSISVSTKTPLSHSQKNASRVSFQGVSEGPSSPSSVNNSDKGGVKSAQRVGIDDLRTGSGNSLLEVLLKRSSTHKRVSSKNGVATRRSPSRESRDSNSGKDSDASTSRKGLGSAGGQGGSRSQRGRRKQPLQQGLDIQVDSRSSRPQSAEDPFYVKSASVSRRHVETPSSPGAGAGAGAPGTAGSTGRHGASGAATAAAAVSGTEITATSSTISVTFFWNGRNALHKLMTSLDFLRDNPFIRLWYDRSFPFLCNPLMLPVPLGDDDVLRTLGLYVRSCGVTRKGEVDLEAGVDFNERVERVDSVIDTEDPVKQRQFYMGFRAKFNTLCEKHRLPMWPTVPSFYGYDDKCAYDLWYFYKALLVLVTPPVIDSFKEALEYERRLISSERHIVTAEDAVNYETQRQLKKLKPPPRPVGLEAVIQRRIERHEVKASVQVPADRVFKYIS